MSTSNISLEQNFNTNDIDIMVFEPCFLFPTYGRFGNKKRGPKLPLELKFPYHSNFKQEQILFKWATLLVRKELEWTSKNNPFSADGAKVPVFPHQTLRLKNVLNY